MIGDGRTVDVATAMVMLDDRPVAEFRFRRPQMPRRAFIGGRLQAKRDRSERPTKAEVRTWAGYPVGLAN